MRSVWRRLAAPRLQVPLATVACFVALASVLLHLLEITALSHTAARVGVGVVALLSYPVAHRLFARSENVRTAYTWAILAPIAVAAIVGALVFIYLSADRPTLLLSIAGVTVDGAFLSAIVPVTLVAAFVGLPGSLVLTVEVWLAAGARAADPERGAHRFTLAAWLIALGMTVCALGVVGAEERTPVLGAALFAASQMTLVALDLMRVRRARAVAVGPYRSAAAR